jgi:hypothetical protein
MDFTSHVELCDEHRHRHVKQNLIKILYINNSNVFMYCTYMDASSQWRTEGRGLGGSNPLPKFRSFDEAELNSQFRGKYICNNLIRIRVSLICKLSGTPD